MQYMSGLQPSGFGLGVDLGLLRPSEQTRRGPRFRPRLACVGPSAVARGQGSGKGTAVPSRGATSTGGRQEQRQLQPLAGEGFTFPP